MMTLISKCMQIWLIAKNEVTLINLVLKMMLSKSVGRMGWFAQFVTRNVMILTILICQWYITAARQGKKYHRLISDELITTRPYARCWKVLGNWQITQMVGSSSAKDLVKDLWGPKSKALSQYVSWEMMLIGLMG